jgi:hypothetical protein
MAGRVLGHAVHRRGDTARARVAQSAAGQQYRRIVTGTVSMTRKLILFVALLLGLPAAALAQSNSADQPRPELFEALLRCRAIADDAAKLQCFETATASLEQAVEAREVVVVDREQVRESRRRLFGLDLPRLPIFGGGGGDDDDDDADDVSSLEGVVASVGWNSLGKYIIRLEDGGTWHQTDDRHLGVEPRRGNKVVINRGALGSYMMRVNGQPGMRVKRQL